MRALAKQWRETGQKDMAKLAEFASGLSNAELFLVSRAFTHFLAIANAAEGHHRTRKLKETKTAALYDKADSCGGVIPALLRQHSPEAVYDALCTQTTELVLTAHPTEVNRRTVLEKKRRIQNILTQADLLRYSVQAISDYDLHQLDAALYREISSVWLTDEVSRSKPTPVQEAAKGTLVLETVLWDAVPSFLRKLDATVFEHMGKRLPLTAQPIKFASWMGGDRDVSRIAASLPCLCLQFRIFV
jgi:phosphoenolpyruvate carboxylase